MQHSRNNGNANKALIRKPEAKKIISETRRRWEDDIQMHLKEMADI
jgi:hypothetical protein